MSSNDFMHPRNVYKVPLNFYELTAMYPELIDYMKKTKGNKIVFDFNNRDGLRCLTSCLLKKDFDLEITIPNDTLVPRLPLRLNYILWLEDLLGNPNSGSKIKGIDIGTGATCIYPLLISRMNSWKMVGTDIKEDIVQVAHNNIARNHLDKLITVVKVSSLRELLSSDTEQFDFCMCNPPFFKSERDVNKLSQKKNRIRRNEKTRFQISGTVNEISSVGGEIEFIKNIIQDSLQLKTRIKIYTTMIGCKSSINPLIKVLKENSIDSFVETTFSQGKTTRWAIAWTFSTDSLQSTTHPYQSKKKTLKPFTQILFCKYEFQECVVRIHQLLEQLKLEFQKLTHDKVEVKWHFKAYSNTWTGLRRLRRQEKQKEQSLKKIKGVEYSEFGISEIETDDIKRKRESDSVDTHDLRTHKKLRIEERSTDGCIFEAELKVKNLQTDTDDTNKISLQIDYLEGQRDAPGQIFYFLKNNLS